MTLVLTHSPHLHAGLAAFPTPADTAQGPSPQPLSPQCSNFPLTGAWLGLLEGSSEKGSPGWPLQPCSAHKRTLLSQEPGLGKLSASV